MADNTNLEFRAQVSFLLDGVPHHVAGAWQQSKKLAQRDCAERCLGAGLNGRLYKVYISLRPLRGLLGCVPTSIHGGHGTWCGSIGSHPSSSKAALLSLLQHLSDLGSAAHSGHAMDKGQLGASIWRVDVAKQPQRLLCWVSGGAFKRLRSSIEA